MSVLNELTPILITSPVRRSGTTLLVRLINSSNQALIYGENAAGELAHLTNFYLQKKLFVTGSQQMRDTQLEETLSGNNNHWTPDLLPKINGYMNALEESCFGLFKYYQNYAYEQGRQFWGMKEPGWNGNLIQMVQQTIPNLKVIYIQRPLKDCLRSAKAVNIVNSVEESNYFCQMYQQNVQSLETMPSKNNILFIDYEDLVRNPLKNIQEIESFVGLSNIDPTIMEKRINTYLDDPRSSKEGYIPPSSLTEEEEKMVNM